MNSSTTTHLAEPGAAGFLAAGSAANGRRPAGALFAALPPSAGPLADFSQLLSRGTGTPLGSAAPASAPLMNAAPANCARPVSPLPMLLGSVPAAGAGEEAVAFTTEPDATAPAAARPAREAVEAAGAVML